MKEGVSEGEKEGGKKSQLFMCLNYPYPGYCSRQEKTTQLSWLHFS